MSGETGTRLAPNRWLVVVAVTAVNIAAGLAAGWVVLVLSRPIQDEQWAALDEIGLPVELEGAAAALTGVGHLHRAGRGSCRPRPPG